MKRTASGQLLLIASLVLLGCAKSKPLSQTVTNRAVVDNGNFDPATTGTKTAKASCTPSDLNVVFKTSGITSLSFQTGTTVKFDLNISGCTGSYKLYRTQNAVPGSPLSVVSAVPASMSYTIPFFLPGTYQERIQVAALNADGTEAAKTEILSSPEFSVFANDILDCSVAALHPVQNVSVDAEGKVIGEMPEFLISLNMAIPSYLARLDLLPYSMEVKSIAFDGVPAGAVQVLDKTASRVELKVKIANPGPASVSFRIADHADLSKAKFFGSCTQNFEAKATLVAPPSCTTNLSKAAARVGEAITASIAPVGLVSLLKMNDSTVTAETKLAVPTDKVGNFTAKGFAQGPGGTATCDANYTVTAPPCGSILVGSYSPRCCIDGVGNCNSQSLSIRESGTKCSISGSFFESQLFSPKYGSTSVNLSIENPQPGSNQMTANISPKSGSIRSWNYAGNFWQTCSW